MIVRKVLVVEDEVDIQKVIRMSLKSRGVAEVVVANDVKPDLILLDVSMPKLDGYQTCRMLKANPETRSIPVIFLTARVQNSEEKLGVEAGAMGYVSKPFDPMKLYDQILAIIEKGTA
jgi:two-component system alkaline phosphatase synthesis response regulator PhoP